MAGGSKTGSVSEKVVPSPTTLSTAISPRLRSASSRTMLRPRPKPLAVSRSPPACLKRSKIISSFSAGMPGPRSVTPMTISRGLPDRRAHSRTPPLSPPYLKALMPRLISTRPIFSGSQKSVGSPVSISTAKSTLLALARRSNIEFDAPDDVLDRAFAPGHADEAGLEAAEVEHVVDETVEIVDPRADHAQIVALLGVQLADQSLLHDGGEFLDHRQRRAELVRHVVDEVMGGLVHRRQPLIGARQQLVGHAQRHLRDLALGLVGDDAVPHDVAVVAPMRHRLGVHPAERAVLAHDPVFMVPDGKLLRRLLDRRCQAVEIVDMDGVQDLRGIGHRLLPRSRRTAPPRAR